MKQEDGKEDIVDVVSSVSRGVSHQGREPHKGRRPFGVLHDGR